MRSEAELREALEVHGPHVYRFLRARGLSEQTAQDVYQDVFEIFLTSNQRFENAEHKRRWLIRVASNRCKQYYRKASTQRETPVSNESFYERVRSLEGDSCEQEAYFDKTARFGNMWTLSHRSSGNASTFSMWRDTQRRKLPQWCNRARRRCAGA